jgi:lipid II:glycine glycyltransferase (peptidoglycan interpeptide bridge formation enzyme)
MLSIHSITNRDEWNHLLESLPGPHILQSWEWGAFKHQTTGWLPERFAYRDGDRLVAAASLLTRRAGPLRVMYVPRGPVMNAGDDRIRQSVLGHLEGLARARHAVWLKIDPDLPLATGIPANETPDEKHPDIPDARGVAFRDELRARGWRFSANQVQFRNTMLLDLTPSEDDLLAGMNQSTRRKIRQAEKAGVQVRVADLNGPDLQALVELYEITGQRQGFLTRPADYYRAAWGAFTAAGLGEALIAEVDGVAAGGVVIFRMGGRAWYFYGMSSNEKRDAQPNYALQWTAIRRAKAAGCTAYDWWGAPDVFTEADPMWGVYRFKDGFGGQVLRTVGAWDMIPHTFLYQIYEGIIPRILRLLRSRSPEE